MNLSFFKNKRILVTGHTGFKGTWLCKILIDAGAIVSGYSLSPSNKKNIYDLSKIGDKMESFIGDIRDLNSLNKVFNHVKPDIVFHLAAQPIVRDSYKNPVYTYETNVIGTVNILECVRTNNCVKSFLNITTDKVYKNNEWEWGYRENDTLNGFDPYSNSKSCSELVTHSYKNSFFKERNIAISTARAGNVIGGGDFSKDRIIPDCVQAVINNETIVIRNPNSVRPYQHVLEPLSAYLMIAQKQYEDTNYAGTYNVGPNEYDCINTEILVKKFCSKWGNGANWSFIEQNDKLHEAKLLKLDCSKIKLRLGWKPHWNIDYALDKVVEWTKVYSNGKSDIPLVMEKQIKEFFEIGEE